MGEGEAQGEGGWVGRDGIQEVRASIDGCCEVEYGASGATGVVATWVDGMGGMGEMGGWGGTRQGWAGWRDGGMTHARAGAYPT